MADVPATVGKSGVPRARLGVALTFALGGLSSAVMGFVVDSAAMIIIGMIVGASGSIAVNLLATEVNP
jgi:NAD/NADP transhydrogenase beta subunit